MAESPISESVHRGPPSPHGRTLVARHSHRHHQLPNQQHHKVYHHKLAKGATTKEELPDEDLFLSPSGRGARPEGLYFSQAGASGEQGATLGHANHHHGRHHRSKHRQSATPSQLRSPRHFVLRDASPSSSSVPGRAADSPPPYTPPPMLSPLRSGQGLYWQVTAARISQQIASQRLSTALGGKKGCVSGESSTSSSPTITALLDDGSLPRGISPSQNHQHYQHRNQCNSQHRSVQSLNCSAPETDITPHVNIGPRFQADLPPLMSGKKEFQVEREKAEEQDHLLWDPVMIGRSCTQSEVDMFLEFACCAAVPGGGQNKEYALHLLQMCHGNIHEAMLRLMQPTPKLPQGHPLLTYQYAESEKWATHEIDAFRQGLFKFDKDFHNISYQIGTKSVKQCIQFYYLWKKVCPDEYRRLQIIQRKKRQCTIDQLSTPQGSQLLLGDAMDDEEATAEMILLGLGGGTLSDQSHRAAGSTQLEEKHTPLVSDGDLVSSTSSDNRLFVCEYSECSASFNSRAALNGHIRIHGGGMGRTGGGGAGGGHSPTPERLRPTANASNNASTYNATTLSETLEEFPCKICGKVFSKVKSRSAHMKSHRPPDAEPKKPKLEVSSPKMDCPSPLQSGLLRPPTPSSAMRGPSVGGNPT